MSYRILTNKNGAINNITYQQVLDYNENNPNDIYLILKNYDDNRENIILYTSDIKMSPESYTVKYNI